MLRVLLLLALIAIRANATKYHFIRAITGEVHMENFTYYTLTNEGTILLELASVSGDCDLYVSQHTIKPTYDPHNNCLQSTTCGLDSVVVPKSFKRPLGLGIFGHPSHEISQYILTITRIYDSHDTYSFHPGGESIFSQILVQVFESSEWDGREIYNIRYEEEEGEDTEEPEGNREELGEVEAREENTEESVYWVFLRSLLTLLIETFIL